MEEDILALMEALTTQASDTDPDPEAAAPAGVAPPTQTLSLEDARSTACQGGNLGQKTAHQRKTEEPRELFSFSPCLSAAVPGLCTDVAPEVASDTTGGGNGGKKNSRKRRNRTKSKKVYLSWPVILETRESSTSPFSCRTSVVEALSSQEQRRKEEEKAVVPAQLSQEPGSTLLPEASPVQPSLEGISVAAREERKAQKRHRFKKRAKKNQKIESSPWPVTVQAWASFVSPMLAQTSFTKSLPAANAGIRGDGSVFTWSEGTQASILGSPAPLMRALWEEVAPDVNTKRSIKKEKHKWWQRKKDNALDHTWPPEIQVRAPFQAAAAEAAAPPVQTLSEDMSLQWGYWPPLESENERTFFIPWSEGVEEGPFFSAIAPLQISLKETPAMRIGQSKTDEAKRSPDTREQQLKGSEVLALDSYQSWGNAEKYQDEDDWDYSILDLPTQAECYSEDPFSEEEDKAPLFIGSDAYTSIFEAETGRQKAEEDKLTFQMLWMRNWGDF